MTDHADFVVRSLVRTYSDTLKKSQDGDDNKSPPQRMLEEALCEEVEQQDALAALLQQAASDRSREASNKLWARYEKLETAFRDFQNAFPELTREKESSKVMSWSSLRQAVAKSQTQYDAKAKKGLVGQSKRRFHRICEIIDNHSNVLKILPQGDKYTSLVCGSLEMIVKASVNHERIGQEFSAALEEIDEIVADVRQELVLYQAPHLKDQGIRLCCKILDFISFPLNWYSQTKRKRLLASFNENLSAEYQIHINKIRRISDHIRRGVHLCTAREVRSIFDMVKYHHDSWELYQREKWRMDEKDWEMFHSAKSEHNRGMRENGHQYLVNMSQHFGGLFNGSVGQPMKQILDKEAEDFVNDRAEVSSKNAPVVPVVPSDENILECDIEPGSKATKSREDIEAASEVLNPFFDFDQIAIEGSTINSFVETEAIQHLQHWTEENSPGFLGVFGPASLSYDSTARLLASNYIQAAKALGFPCISYFCVIANENPPLGRLRETVGLVALLYGMIKQVTLHLPRRIVSHAAALDIQKFEMLDGTLRTWEQAVLLFQDLLDLVEPPFLIIAIYGMEVLEHEATNKYLSRLIELLRTIILKQRANKNGGKVFKILFTTCGTSQVLAAQLKEEEIFNLNRGNTSQNPGQAKKGRLSMNYLSYT